MFLFDFGEKSWICHFFSNPRIVQSEVQLQIVRSVYSKNKKQIAKLQNDETIEDKDKQQGSASPAGSPLPRRQDKRKTHPATNEVSGPAGDLWRRSLFCLLLDIVKFVGSEEPIMASHT